mmetsp:Transcript_15273/g.22460  ORF Transcript_15273/g.22460 Transcript_15273/m.22460 type:complete len:298 (-) Transcript_15273:106-999(-)|eukprot:CAMPEP_0113935472 /NCGR_PEP_ID=MMETSP1339-20121228/2615_1 /TAXON_ID=94617 /ORGANISM="Fibrocapsa japonica" /LENGTH=297 /DNA_ID=CAMNT_0000937635 /DNA_START=53 /DNA_END=946 /DNA_ORIENTATION=+ /assembly_acc=CAM_ASM_000762
MALLKVPKLFQDLGKSTSDLINDDFVYAKKLKLKTVTENGVAFTSEGQLDAMGTIAHLGANYHHPSGVNLDNLQVTTQGRIALQGSLKVAGPKGTDLGTVLSVNVEDGRHELGKPYTSHGKIGVEHVKDGYSLTADLDVVNGPSISTSGLLKVRWVKAGFVLGYDSGMDDVKKQGGALTAYGCGVGVDRRTWNMALYTQDKASDLVFSWCHAVNPDLTVGGQLEYSLWRNAQRLTVGGKLSLDPQSHVRCRVDSDAMIALAYCHQLSPQVSLGLSAEVDAKDFASDSHKFGVSLSFG